MCTVVLFLAQALSGCNQVLSEMSPLCSVKAADFNKYDIRIWHFHSCLLLLGAASK